MLRTLAETASTPRVSSAVFHMVRFQEDMHYRGWVGRPLSLYCIDVAGPQENRGVSDGAWKAVTEEEELELGR